MNIIGTGKGDEIVKSKEKRNKKEDGKKKKKPEWLGGIQIRKRREFQE